MCINETNTRIFIFHGKGFVFLKFSPTLVTMQVPNEGGQYKAIDNMILQRLNQKTKGIDHHEQD